MPTDRSEHPLSQSLANHLHLHLSQNDWERAMKMGIVRLITRMDNEGATDEVRQLHSVAYAELVPRLIRTGIFPAPCMPSIGLAEC